MNPAAIAASLRSRSTAAFFALLLGCEGAAQPAPSTGQGGGAGATASAAAGSASQGGRDASAAHGGALAVAGSSPVDTAGEAGLASGGTGVQAGAPSEGGTIDRGGSAQVGGHSESPSAGTTGSATIRSGVAWLDDQGNAVNAHGGGVIQVGDTFYLHGMYITYSANASKDANSTFKGFSMYSSRDLATWKFEKLVLRPQANGELGPNRVGERPHIIRCPSTGEFVLYAHAASLDYQTDKEVVYATSTTVNGDYAYRGPLTNAAGQRAEHSDMSAFVDGDNVPYVLTEGGHVYKLAADCHSWLSDTTYSAIGGTESPTLFKAGSAYYWLMSEKTGWRANDNTYATAAGMTGPWTKQGLVAPAGQKTWLSQSTWVLPVVGSKGTTYVFWGDRWDGTESTDHPGRNNSLATLVVQPLVLNAGKASMTDYHETWKLNVSEGTRAP